MRDGEIGLPETKTRLSEVIGAVRQGTTFIIIDYGKRVAELRPPVGCARPDEQRRS